MSHDTEIYRFLTTDNSETFANANMNGVGSVGTPIRHWIAPDGDDRILLIRRLILGIRDAGSWSSEKYGAIAGGLTNGCKVSITDDDWNDLLVLTPGNVKSNAGWAAYCYDSRIDTIGAGDSFLAARWSFFKDTNKEGLYIHKGERLVFSLQDDMGDLAEHYATVRGVHVA